MENELEELLLQFTYYYGIRMSNRDKRNVYYYLVHKFQDEFQLPVKFDKLSVGISRIGLCIAGDITNAQKILIVPLDTPPKSVLPDYRYYPFHEKRKELSHLVCWWFNTVLCLLLAVISYQIVQVVFSSSVGSFLVALGVIAVFQLFLRNRVNFSSSAGLALLTFLASKDQSKEYAYVFLDHSVEDYLSLKLFLVKYKQECMHAKQVIFMNDLANGEELVCMVSEQEKYRYQKLLNIPVTILSSQKEGALRCFDSIPHLLVLVSAEKDKHQEYVVTNTRSTQDKKMNVIRLKALRNQLI